MRTFVAIVLLGCTLGASAEVARPGCESALALAPDQRRNGGASVSTPALDRYYDLSQQLKRAFASASPVTAAPIAEEYLRTADDFPCNWDYGNAIHNANEVLGLLAVRDGRRGDAVRYLRAAGKSPGSPQLDSFGPSLLLARDLARLGEYDAVVEYLVSISRFWKARDESIIGMTLPIFADPDPIHTWIGQLRQGYQPSFSLMNLHAP
jgi:hypothetical protein